MKTICTFALAFAVTFFSRVNIQAAAPPKPKPPAPVDAPAKPNGFVVPDPTTKPMIPLLIWGMFPSFFTQDKYKALLKIEKDQEPGLEAAMKKWRFGFPEEKKPFIQPGKPIDIFGLEKAQIEAMFVYLASTLNVNQIKRMKQLMRQESGMDIFDHKEIRDQLGLNNEDVKKLRKIHGQLGSEINSAMLTGKFSKEEISKRYDGIHKGVPDRVRAGLNAEQQKKLQELIGDQVAP
jgi:hypothetical protein